MQHERTELSTTGHQHAGSPELARAMGAVARELLGEPTEKRMGGNEWRWGSHGSLSIRVDKGVWTNHEDGGGGGVLDFLRVRKGLADGAALEFLRERGLLPRESATRGSRIVAKYDYQAPDGTLLYQVVREDPKRFPQRRPDGKGGWVWNLDGVRRVPYRLPELLAASLDQVVYIVEGEKDVEALRRLGLVATCNPGGAAQPGQRSKWPLEFGEHFAGRDVVVIPDNDLAGAAHAEAVVRSLGGKASGIRLLKLPDLPPKGDVSDWLDAGGDLDHLEQLLRDLPEAEPIGPPSPSDEEAQSSAGQESKQQPSSESLVLVDPRTLAGMPIPPREWIVEDWLPFGHVTLSYGDGGVGKTLLAQQLMTACASGAYWCGLTTRRCRVFGLFCEDDAAEVHRRQDRINAALGVDWGDLGDMRWACAVGADNVLVRFEADGSWHTTPRFDQVLQAARDFGAQLLVLDTAADTFGGNENDRQQVRAFLGPVLTKLARDIGGAVLLNAHPSRSGLSTSGDMDGGSTAWSNTARSRWALTRPAADEGAAPDENLRILSRRKSNYAARGDEIELRWRAGAFMPVQEAAPTGFAAAARNRTIEATFLAVLDRCTEQNIFVSISKNAHNFAPKVFAKRPERDGCTRQDFERAMNQLLADDQLTNEQYGRKHDEHYRLARVSKAVSTEDQEVDLAAD